MTNSTSTFTPGQRVHHRSLGPGCVTEASARGAVRVLFSSGIEPLVRVEDLMSVPQGFEPVFLDPGIVADYAKRTCRPGFTVEEIILPPSGERVVWIASNGSDPGISIDQARELVQILQAAISSAEEQSDDDRK